MSAVEICCTAADRPRIDWLAFALAERGWACGWNVDCMPHADALCAIVVWSNATRDAPWLRGVARGARRRGILVSATLDGVQPPRALRSNIRVDLSQWPAKTVDRAIDELLDDVASVIAHPKPVREAPTQTGDRVVVAVVATLFVGLVYWLVTAEQRGSLGTTRSSADSRELPHAVRTMPDAETIDASPEAAVGSTMPQPEAAATLGRRALNELMRALGGDAEMADRARTSALAALRVDPTEPNARFVHALCRSLLDGEWQQAARIVGDIDEQTLTGDARDLAARWHLLRGEVAIAGRLVTEPGEATRDLDIAVVLDRLAPATAIDPTGEPVGVAEAPLCALLEGDDLARAADAYRTSTPAARLALLSQPCFLRRTATSYTVRTWLGIGA